MFRSLLGPNSVRSLDPSCQEYLILILKFQKSHGSYLAATSKIKQEEPTTVLIWRLIKLAEEGYSVSATSTNSVCFSGKGLNWSSFNSSESEGMWTNLLACLTSTTPQSGQEILYTPFCSMPSPWSLMVCSRVSNKKRLLVSAIWNPYSHNWYFLFCVLCYLWVSEWYTFMRFCVLLATDY